MVKAICEMVSRSEFVNSLKELDVLCPDLDGAETLEKDKPSCSFTPETKQKVSGAIFYLFINC